MKVLSDNHRHNKKYIYENNFFYSKMVPTLNNNVILVYQNDNDYWSYFIHDCPLFRLYVLLSGQFSFRVIFIVFFIQYYDYFYMHCKYIYIYMHNILYFDKKIMFIIMTVIVIVFIG